MTADEFSIHSCGRSEVDGDLDDEEVIKPAMVEYGLDFVIGQPSVVVRHEGDFPCFEPTLTRIILPINLGVISCALVMAASFIGRGVSLAAHKGIFCHLEIRQFRWFPALRRP